MELKEKIVLITGGNRGLGLEIAKTFAKAGASLVLMARSLDVTYLVNGLTLTKKQWSGGSCDVTDLNDVRAFFSRTIEPIGRLDVVINNAGGAYPFGDFFSLSDDDWRGAYELNCMGPMRICREAIPYLQKSESGRIINIASVPAHQPGSFNPHYAAAKAALLNMTKYLANTLAKDNILVNAVCPGTLHGGGWDRNARSKAERLAVSPEAAEEIMMEEERKKVPLGRIGELSDVSELVLFLASPKNNFITGTCINIDGGVTRSII